MAEADFQEARHVLAGYMELGEVLAKQPENELLASEVLTRLIPVYDGFFRRHPDDPVAWDEVLQARFRSATPCPIGIGGEPLGLDRRECGVIVTVARLA